MRTATVHLQDGGKAASQESSLVTSSIGPEPRELQASKPGLVPETHRAYFCLFKTRLPSMNTEEKL